MDFDWSFELDHADARRSGSIPATAFERHSLAAHVANAIARLSVSGRPVIPAEAFFWLDTWGLRLGLVPPDLSTPLEKMSTKDQATVVTETFAARRRTAGNLVPSALEKRLAWITSSLRLGVFDAAILKAAVRAIVHRPLHQFCAALVGGAGVEDEVNLKCLGLFLGRTPEAVRIRMKSDHPLMALGLLEDRGAGDFAPSETVLRLARLKRSEPEILRRELFGRKVPAQLGWADFAHLGPLRDLAARLFDAALERNEKGVGILLYGAPGTGKTEFAKTLAEEIGASAVFIGEADENRKEPSRSDRVSHFALTSKLAASAGRTILIVDEADDLFTGVDSDDRASRTGSKVFMNRLVEECAAPTIWITNAPDRLGPAVLRRMAIAIRFNAPSRDVRRRMVKRLAVKRHLKLDPDGVDALAAMDMPPAILDAGLRTAVLTGGGATIAAQGAGSLLAALSGRAAIPPADSPIGFDATLSAADCDLIVLAERAEASFRAGGTALSFCLHGLPGTGKSAYARFIAERLEIEVIEKRASDLLSMFLGGTEQNIASAFAEAADRKAMLIIDEADSLLLDRGRAERSWEISQVNEMLTWMERHPMPFVCTTNLIGSLDPATLRRFLFKVEFRAMEKLGAREAFMRAFGIDAPPALDALDLLTPGDFAVVMRKAKVLGARDIHALVAMLAAEVAAKPEGRKARIGF